jgi:hypothetical protein
VLPYTREHAIALFGLPWHHTDPSTGRSWRRRLRKTSRSSPRTRRSRATQGFGSSGRNCYAGARISNARLQDGTCCAAR